MTTSNAGSNALQHRSTSLQELERLASLKKQNTKNGTRLEPIRLSRLKRVKGKQVPLERPHMPRQWDQATCLRAPLEPLSPKSPEVVESIKPLKEGIKWPQRWNKKKSAIQEVVEEARRDAFRKTFSEEVIREWEMDKRRKERVKKQNEKEHEMQEIESQQQRKKNNDASYNLWKTKKKLNEIHMRVAYRQKRRKNDLPVKEKIKIDSLEMQVLRLEKELKLRLRGEKESISTEFELQESKIDDSVSETSKEKMDVNDDARVDDASFACAKLKLRLDRDKSRLKVSFDQIDTGGDGTISQDEFAKVVGSLAPTLSATEILAVFQAVDIDRSGQITFQELNAALRRIPDEILMKVRKEERRLQKKMKSDMVDYYKDFKSRVPRRILSRLENPKVYIAFHSWKVASRTGMTAETQRPIVESLLLTEKVMSLLREEMNKDRAKFLNVFRELDRSGDGLVDLAELTSALRHFGMSKSDSKAAAKKVFQYVDRDRSGFLEYIELVRTLKAMDRSRQQVKMRREKKKKLHIPGEGQEIESKIDRPSTTELEMIDARLEAVRQRMQEHKAELEENEINPPAKKSKRGRKTKRADEKKKTETETEECPGKLRRRHKSSIIQVIDLPKALRHKVKKNHVLKSPYGMAKINGKFGAQHSNELDVEELIHKAEACGQLLHSEGEEAPLFDPEYYTQGSTNLDGSEAFSTEAFSTEAFSHQDLLDQENYHYEDDFDEEPEQTTDIPAKDIREEDNVVETSRRSFVDDEEMKISGDIKEESECVEDPINPEEEENWRKCASGSPWKPETDEDTYSKDIEQAKEQESNEELKTEALLNSGEEIGPSSEAIIHPALDEITSIVHRTAPEATQAPYFSEKDLKVMVSQAEPESLEEPLYQVADHEETSMMDLQPYPESVSTSNEGKEERKKVIDSIDSASREEGNEHSFEDEESPYARKVVDFKTVLTDDQIELDQRSKALEFQLSERSVNDDISEIETQTIKERKDCEEVPSLTGSLTHLDEKEEEESADLFDVGCSTKDGSSSEGGSTIDPSNSRKSEFSMEDFGVVQAQGGPLPERWRKSSTEHVLQEYQSSLSQRFSDLDDAKAGLLDVEMDEYVSNYFEEQNVNVWGDDEAVENNSAIESSSLQDSKPSITSSTLSNLAETDLKAEELLRMALVDYTLFSKRFGRFSPSMYIAKKADSVKETLL